MLKNIWPSHTDNWSEFAGTRGVTRRTCHEETLARFSLNTCVSFRCFDKAQSQLRSPVAWGQKSRVVYDQCIISIIFIIPPTGSRLSQSHSLSIHTEPEEVEGGWWWGLEARALHTHSHTQTVSAASLGLLNRLPHSEKTTLTLFFLLFLHLSFRFRLLLPSTALSLTRTQTTISCPFFHLATTTARIGGRSLWRPMGVRDRRVFGRSARAGWGEYRQGRWSPRSFGAACHCQCSIPCVLEGLRVPLALILRGLRVVSYAW